MNVDAILKDWKKHDFKPIYWLEGEESYFIDKLMHYAEHHILNEAEAAFNKTVFYGKDAAWQEVINACRRYPMFAEKQVVLLKEAQHMRDIEKLEPYIENPLPSTIFIVSYKEKKIDGRSKMAKLLKQKVVVVTTKKINENELPGWAENVAKQNNLSITPKALILLVDHVGNDLSRIENEIEKLKINLNGRKNITEDDIENYIGISKEFNVFELQKALAEKSHHKVARIIHYFEKNPKAGPIQLILPTLYGFFSKVYAAYALNTTNENQLISGLGINYYVAKDCVTALHNYSFQAVENILLQLHQYNLRSVGVNDVGTTDAGLLKELCIKILV